MQQRIPTGRETHPLLILIALAGSMLVCELIIMFVLALLPSLDPVVEALVDGLLLSAGMIPVVYLLVYRPMARGKNELARRVKVRTAELERANESLTRAINERQRTEEQLLRTQSHYRNLVEKVPAIVYLAEIGMEGRFHYVSPQVEPILGFRVQEMLKDPALWFRQVHPEDRQRALADEEASLSTGRPLVSEYRMLTRDGRILWMHDEAVLLHGEPGQPPMIQGVLMDITDLKQAEEALRQAEEKYRTIFENALEGIYRTTFDGRWLAANPMLARTLGYASAEDLMEGTADLERSFYLDPGRRAEFVRLVERDRETTDFESQVRRKDGEVIWISERARGIRNEEGRLVGFEGMTVDITARKEFQEEMRKAKEAAEAASRSKSEFLAMMSHEIRTPMNGILGMLSLLMESGLEPRQHQLARTARSSAEALLTILNDILDFSKIEAEKLETETIPFDLGILAEDSAAAYAAQAEERRIDLIIRLAPLLPRRVMGDPGRIRQCLGNLIANGVKFTHDGSVIVTVEPDTTPTHEDHIRFRVADSGIGIPAERLSSIFERFTQVDSSTTRRYGGTGLGLAITKRLVHLMGGTISVRSSLGHGSEFSFTLPLPVTSETIAPIPPEIDLAGIRVLIVDDNTINCEVLNEQLSALSMRTAVVCRGDAALDALHTAHANSDPFQIAVIDYQMPDMDGVALARAIRLDPAVRETLLVLLTSIGERGGARELREAGFDAYLVKPIRQSALVDALRAVWSAKVGGRAGGFVTRHTIEEARRAAGTNSLRFSAKALVVEDNATNQQVAMLMLQRLGCDVDIAADGREAISAVAGGGYDVIFMDCEMPVMDGFETTAEIRSREAGQSHLAIVAMTARALAGERERCLQAGMDEYVSKPLRMDDLSAVLRRFARSVSPEGEASVDPVQAHRDARPASRSVLDPAAFARLRSLASDPASLAELARTFIAQARELIQAMRKGAGGGSFADVQRPAHTLVGAAGNFGALRLAELARAVEHSLVGGLTEGIQVGIGELDDELSSVIAAIRAEDVSIEGDEEEEQDA